MKRKSKTTTKAKTPSKERIIKDTLYCYVDPINARFARTQGVKLGGSTSSFINTLLIQARRSGKTATAKTTTK
jgi:hypothetical protein